MEEAGKIHKHPYLSHNPLYGWSQAQALSHTKKRPTPVIAGETTTTYKTPFSGEHTWIARPLPKKPTPQMKAKAYPTIRVKFPSNSESNMHTKAAARLNHKNDAHIRIKILFFFYYKKKQNQNPTAIRQKSKCNRI